MNYKETIDTLYRQLPAYHRIGKAAYKSNLNNILALDEYLKHPHRKYKTIHVAGTNGKGSVSHLIASILQEAGYRTGLYTSPHLRDFRERIKVNGKPIKKRSVVEFVKRHSEFIGSLNPSFFEITVAMAFNHFEASNVEIAVIEVGLGGRLDSTNIITPLLSIITNIGHDHMDLLGNTIEMVATEKAGIIKNNIPVVVGETQDKIKDIFIARASEAGSEIFFADQNFTCFLESYDYTNGSRGFTITDNRSDRLFEGRIPLAGDYQSKNLQALAQVFYLLKDVLKITDSNLIKGIRKVVRNTGLFGRWQVLGHNPLIICDTGHNREGLDYVIQQLKSIPKTKLRCVIGFVTDKDLGLVLPLFPADAYYYFTKASVPRALHENDLMKEACKYKLKGERYPNVSEAMKAAKNDAVGTDVIFIGGSTFIVAEVI
jgi:dihydrofolate synthase/folylpolyglutamate synthase